MSEIQQSKVTFEAIVADVILLVKARWALLLAIALILAVMNAWVDWMLTPPAWHWVSFLLVLLSIYLTVVITCAALKDLRLLPGRSNKWQVSALIFPAALLQIMIYTVGLLAGMVLLIVPGLVLLVRWSPGLPILIVEKIGIWEALERSWDATSGRWTLVAELAIVSTLLFLPSIISTGWYSEEMGRSFRWTFGDHVFSYLSSELLTLGTVAFYRQLRRGAEAAPAKCSLSLKARS